MGRLEGKNCIVTGAGSGIGLETAVLFAKEGANVVLADINEQACVDAVEKIQVLAPNVKLQAVECDVSKENEVAKAINSAEPWGGADVVFNNAGIMHGLDNDAIDTPEAVWDQTQNVNVKGVWFGCKHAVLAFRKFKKTKGSVINTASVVALVGSATPQLAYTASKGAVLAMTRELAIVHAREGYRFNSLCPAPLNTPLLQSFLGTDAARRHRREVHFPTGRFGEPIEQAHMVVFLASDDSSFVTGQEMVVDGGMTKAYVTPEGKAVEPPKNNLFGTM